ncbi:ATP-binding protein [Verrucomicrobiota bacterium]
MSTQLQILIIASAYAETTHLTPLLRELGYKFTFLDDVTQLAKPSRLAEFNALFISLPYLRQADITSQQALKSVPKHVPLFFVADQLEDENCHQCAGVQSLDTIVNSDEMRKDTERCLRIAEQMRCCASPTASPAANTSLTPLYAQRSGIRTQNKLMQEEVSREQLINNIFDNMRSVAVRGYNKNREVIFWNKVSEEFYGYSEEEALGQKFEELIMPGFAAQAAKGWEEKRIPIPAAEFALKHKEGHLVPVFSSPAGFNNPNGEFEIYCLDIDLSEIKEEQEAAKKLSKLPSENPNPVMRLNQDGKIVYANPASDQLLKLWGKQVGDSIPDEYREFSKQAIQEKRVLYRSIACEEQIFDAAFTPVDHGANYLNIYALDVTDRENAFKALHSAKLAAEAANRAKNNFLANMSHELRTPLNGIMGMAQLLEHSPLATGMQNEVKLIISSANTLLGIINDILDITAIERDKITPKNEDFNLKQILQCAINVITPAADSKNLSISHDYPVDQPESFNGDQKYISQTVVNLLNNAVKFTDYGSITLGVEIDTSQVSLSVTDTGIGIPSDKLEYIFKKFTQIDTSKTRRHGGTGLGLNIAKNLAESMGGSISASSKEGKGSTFTVTLPLQATQEEKAPECEKQTWSSNRTAHILLAEDNRINQLVATKMFMSLGCEVDVAENGAKALSYARDNDYDLVVMDIQMPEMNGIDATRAIRQIEGARGKVPIVALTAHTTNSDMRACSDAGMNGFFSKPLKLEDLENMLTDFLPPNSEETGHDSSKHPC